MRRNWLNDPDITGHMVAGDCASDNDAVYLYRFEVTRVVLYKVGLTSLSRGTERIYRTMMKAGTTAHDVHIWPVDDARETERKLLELVMETLGETIEASAKAIIVEIAKKAMEQLGGADFSSEELLHNIKDIKINTPN